MHITNSKCKLWTNQYSFLDFKIEQVKVNTYTWASKNRHKNKYIFIYKKIDLREH